MRDAVQSPSELTWIGNDRPIGTHDASWFARLGLMPFGVIGAVGGIIGAVLYIVTDFAPVPDRYAYAAAIFAGGLAVGAFEAWRIRPTARRVQVYPEGLVWEDGDGWWGLRWSDIKGFRREELRINSMWKKREFSLTFGPSSQVVFRAVFTNWPKLADLVQSKFDESVLPRIIADFEAGKLVDFGQAKMSLRGVESEGRLLPWSDIEQIHFRNGQVWVEGKKARTGFDLESARLDHVHVFVRLAESQLGRGRTTA